ncbi:5-methylthioadenosine/S-adenosylhomocysteine deaminase [Paucibacter oligotrophus]|uniref:5-methylthioadenosine/S-adenosylhomocysteine deaminase n=1 Tax=Roseateles oligotrophus TaxID=1769250 RepID=A0A840L8F4_9BURK|nr:TRZ/ATZ family hydrolase [Roseateles oligotrophus]MBB4844041.1 5-methylthioadenosine/S-adenosylhomocysteine deaminase [Roseateles oligotrophus]
MSAQTTILKARWLLPMSPGSQVLNEHALVIQGERIAAILPWAQAAQQFPDAATVELGEHVLIPGLINAHTHSAMSLLRGVADDVPLMDWLNNHIWPLEKKWVSEDWTYQGSLLSACEALRGGVTYLNDMYFFPTAMARAALDSGLRAGVSINVIDFPTGYAANAGEYISKGLEAYEQYKGEKLLDWTSAPHAPYTVSDETFIQLRDLRDRLGLQMHCHIHETQFEVDESVKQHGMRPLERLNKLGLLDSRMMAVHMVHLNEAEIAMLGQQGVHVVHNPNSNMKLASGVCPVTALEAAGVNTVLGTDGAASNNRQDMFGEIRAAALLAKGVTQNSTTVSARTALEMATLRAAKAMGREADLGSLEVGKLADVVAVSLAALECRPVYNPEAQLVYVAGREHVSDVWVGGKQLLKNRLPTQLDQAAVLDRIEAIVAQMKAQR